MKRFLLSALAVILLAGCAGEPSKRTNISFAGDVQPIFEEHCTLCHAEGVRQGGIALDSYENLMSSRYFSRPTPLVMAGKPEESRIYLVMHSTNPGIRMPPPGTGLHSPDERAIETVRVWIKEGAKNN